MRLRDRFLSWIKKKTTRFKKEADEEIDFFVREPTRAAAAFCRKLPIKEDGYNFVAGSGHSDARAYYFYGISDEIIKTGVAALRWRELLGGPELPPADKFSEDDRADRLCLESVLDEQHLWLRKLTEHLIDIIGFSKYNGQPYYRAFLAAVELDAHLSIDSDTIEFFGCNNLNNGSGIEMSVKTLEECQTVTKASTLPFLKHPISANSKFHAGRIFLSIRARYKKALLLCTTEEKLILGTSYEDGFSKPSKSLHGQVRGPMRLVTWDDIRKGTSRVGLISFHILRRAHELCGIKPEGLNEQMGRLLSSGQTNATELMKRTNKQCLSGDLVLIGDRLAEVTKVNKTIYGYESYGIKYLTKPHIPEVVEDCFPSQYCSLLVRRQNIRSFWEKNLCLSPQGRAAWKKLKNLSDDKMHEAIKGLFSDFDNAGILIPMLQKKKNPDAD